MKTRKETKKSSKMYSAILDCCISDPYQVDWAVYTRKQNVIPYKVLKIEKNCIN